VNLIDLSVSPLSEELLLKEASRADTAGIGFMTSQAEWALDWGRKIRKELGKPVIFGGPHSAALPEESLKSGAADFVCMGEGEPVMLELAEALEDGIDSKTMRGIACVRDGSVVVNEPHSPVELKTLALPARHFFDLNKYELGYYGFDNSRPVASIVGSRGCFGKCTFCCSHVIMGRRVRFFPAERVFEEVVELYQRYGIEQINFSDDTFLLNRKNVEDFLRMLLDAKLNITWSCSSRADTLNQELLRMMKSAGCVRVGLGIESGSQEILDNIKKGTTVEQNETAIEMVRKAKLAPYAYLMVGNSGENWQTVKETIDFIRRTKVHASVTFATPFPGTEFYDYVKERNLLRPAGWSDFVTYGGEPVARTESMDLDDIVKAKGMIEAAIRESASNAC